MDAKDIILANISDRDNGYSLLTKDGNINYRKFVNVLDYSLELIKLREVYRKVYRNNKMTFMNLDKEYTKHVINVTFKYAVHEYNRINSNTYVKYGYNAKDLEFDDSVCIINGELAGIKIGNDVVNPISDELLGKNFIYIKNEGDIYGTYEAKNNIKTIISSSDARYELYKNGFYCDGIHYVRFKRSSGSARVGKCLFIDEKLYSRMHRWECCGLKVREGQQIDLAAWESYISLTSSSIIGTLEILPENILVIDDFDSVFEDDVIATRAVDGRLQTKEEHVTIKNCIWDGQSIIDKSAMSEYKEFGMLLLRNRFFKSCSFNGEIQKWFVDNGITDVSQLNGYTRAKCVEEIKLITTPSSIKYLKFGTLDQWMDNLDSTFGVVKHDKKTHYFDGRMVQTHYQLINTLQLDEDEVRALLDDSLQYAKLIKNDVAAMRYYLKYNMEEESEHGFSPIINKNDIVFNMLNLNDEFANTKVYGEFKRKLMTAYIKNIRYGHILVNGNYSTMLGNPIEMLQASIGLFNGESQLGVGNIHSTNFEYNKTILGSRSPHVTVGNVWLTINSENELIDTYMNLTPEIVCINSIKENVLNRLSGSDFDSDTCLLTDNEILIKAAEKNYHHFKVPTGFVSADKANRYYTDEQKADLDIKTSVNKIGEIINFSQILNSVMWDNIANGQTIEENIDLYCDISQLDVMSNLEIDKAKKIFTTDNVFELKCMREKYKHLLKDDEGKDIKPNFFIHLARKKGLYIPGAKNYKKHQTSMDYLQRVINQYNFRERYNTNTINLSDILDKTLYVPTEVNCHQINRIMDLMRYQRDSIKRIYSKTESEIDNSTKIMMVNDIKMAVLNELKKMKFTYSTAYRLMKLSEDPNNSDIGRMMFYSLMGIPNKTFYDVFIKSKNEISYIIEDNAGDVLVHGIKFKKVYKSA